jgi:hypothetical protein
MVDTLDRVDGWIVKISGEIGICGFFAGISFHRLSKANGQVIDSL